MRGGGFQACLTLVVAHGTAIWIGLQSVAFSSCLHLRKESLSFGSDEGARFQGDLRCTMEDTQSARKAAAAVSHTIL